MNKQTVLRPIPTTGKTKKILEKPKFWKWKGRTERPVAEKVEINNNKGESSSSVGMGGVLTWLQRPGECETAPLQGEKKCQLECVYFESTVSGLFK